MKKNINMKNLINKATIFLNQKRTTDKQPHYTGSIFIDREMMNKFIEETRFNPSEPMKLETLLYENKGKQGNTYYTLYVKRPTIFKNISEVQPNSDDGFTALSKITDDYPF